MSAPRPVSWLVVAACLVVAQSARAMPSATLTLSLSDRPGNPIANVADILLASWFNVSVQYEISGLDQPAHLEADICNYADWLVELPTGGTVSNGDSRCPANPSQFGRTYLVRGPTLSPGSGASQSVTGVFSFGTFSQPGVLPDNTPWTIPLRLVLDGPGLDLVTDSVSVNLRAQPDPHLAISVVAVDLATGPDGITPGFNVLYRINPSNASFPGVTYLPGASTFVDPVPASAEYVSALIDSYSNSPPDIENSNQTLTTTTDTAGHVNAVVFSASNFLTGADQYYRADLLVTLWFPMVMGGSTVMTNQAFAHWANGVEQNASVTTTQGTVRAGVGKNVQTYDAYIPPGRPFEWAIGASAYDDGSGPGGSFVTPVIIDQLPPHLFVSSFRTFWRQDGADLKPLSTLQVSTDPDCNAQTTSWDNASWTDASTFAAAHCFRVAMGGLVQAFTLVYTTELAEPWLGQLSGTPGAQEYEDNTATISAPNISEGYVTGVYGLQPGSSTVVTARAKIANINAPAFRQVPEGTYEINAPFLGYGLIPWAYSIESTAGFDNLTFSDTLPLDLDLDGPPIPGPNFGARAFATDGLGNDLWQPTCTWSAQLRSGATITPAWYRCTFPGHFPATRVNPFAQANCQVPHSYTSCFAEVYNATSDNNGLVFNSYDFAVPMHLVAGAPGQPIQGTMKIWADNTPPVVAAGLPGTSEATPLTSNYTITAGGRLEMVLRKTAPANTLVEGASMTYTIGFSNTGTAGTTHTRIYDLFGRDSRTGSPLSGCERPRFVSATTASLGALALIDYTTDSAPTPNATWLPTAPGDVSTVTGVRITPMSAFSSTGGEYSPNDLPLEVQVTLADTAGVGGKMCNSASLLADGFSATLSTAGEADVVATCQPHIYAPAFGEHGLILFEDLWPAKGDYDFNDQAVTYNQELALDQNGNVTELLATFNVLASGAKLHNGLYWRLPLPANTPVTIVRTDDAGHQTTLTHMSDESQLVVELAHDTRDLFTGGSGFLNTVQTQPVAATHAFNVHLTFTTPVALDTSLPPYDVFIAHSDDFSHQIHLSDQTGTDQMNAGLFNHVDDNSGPTARFVDRNGVPFALLVPAAVRWPTERTAIDVAYPDILGFAISAGHLNPDWYVTNVQSASVYSHGASNALPPSPVLLGSGLSGACH